MTQSSIIVVDDTLANLRLLERILSEQGYAVRPFPRAALALQAAERCPPDLFLMDIRMPGMDGYAACRKIQESEQLSGIPVIFISSLSAVEEKVTAFEHGGVDFINKPFEVAEVCARVQTHLQLRCYRLALEEKNLELLQTVRQLEDTQEQLVASEKMAALGALMAGLSHQMNTPLGNAITAVSSLLGYGAELQDRLQGQGNQEVADNLALQAELGEMAQSSLEQAADLVAQYRQLVAVEAGRIERVAVRELLNEALACVADSLGRRGISVTLDLAPGLELQTIPSLFCQIFIQLLQNSMQHGFEGGSGRITIRCRQMEGQVEIRYEDDGRGVDAQRIGSLFDPFGSGNLAQGSGLGLFKVYNLTLQLGAQVAASCPPAGGLALDFTFPLAEQG